MEIIKHTNSFISNFKGEAQLVIGVVVDEEGSTMQGVMITYDTSQTKTITDIDGTFKFKRHNKGSITFTYIGYNNYEVTPDFSQGNDTLQLFIKLKPSATSLIPFEVSSNRIKTILNANAVNVIDYKPFSKFTLILNTHKGDRLLSFSVNNEITKEYDISAIKAKSIFEDCFGYLHLLTKDTAYQIEITDASVEIIGKIDLNTFQSTLMPCIGDFRSGMVFGNYTNHQKKYTLTYIDKTDKTKKPFYYSWDKVGEKVARQAYNQIIGYYYAIIDDEEKNIIELGVWNGNVIALAENSDINSMISWYLKFEAKPLNIYTHRTPSNIVSFDLYKDSVFIFNYEGLLISSLPYNNSELLGKSSVVIDPYRNTFYSICEIDAVFHVYEFDIKTGRHILVMVLDDAAHSKNVRIFDGWLYFIKRDGNYYRLYKVQLHASP